MSSLLVEWIQQQMWKLNRQSHFNENPHLWYICKLHFVFSKHFMGVFPFSEHENREKLTWGSFSRPLSKGDCWNRVASRDGNAGQCQPPPHRRQFSYQHYCLCYQGPFTIKQFRIYIEVCSYQPNLFKYHPKLKVIWREKVQAAWFAQL